MSAACGDALADLLVRDAFLLGPFIDRKVDGDGFAQLLAQACSVPLLGIGVFRDIPRDEVVDHLMAHVVDRLGHVLAAHDADALLEDDLALVVHHIVEFEQVLADVEVARFDLLLGLFQRLVDPRMDDRLVLLEAQLLQHRIHALGTEDAHEVVIEREIEQRAAGIALAAGAAAQLVVDAPALVALGADDEQAAGSDHLLLVALDLGADLLLASAALGTGLQFRQLGSDAHLDSCRRA